MREDQLSAIAGIILLGLGLISDILENPKAPVILALGAIMFSVCAIQYADYRFRDFIQELEKWREEQKKAKK